MRIYSQQIRGDSPMVAALRHRGTLMTVIPVLLYHRGTLMTVIPVLLYHRGTLMTVIPVLLYHRGTLMTVIPVLFPVSQGDADDSHTCPPSCVTGGL